MKVTEANIPLTCLYSLHTSLGSFCPAPNSECCEVHFKWEPRKAGSASTPAKESTAVAWQWWWPEGKDKEKDGATCPAALPTQKVTLGTLLKGKEALWGDEGVWFPSLATEGKVVGQCPPFQLSPPTPQKHLGTGPVLHAHMDRSSRHTSVQTHTLPGTKGNCHARDLKAVRGSCAPQSQQTVKSYSHHKDAVYTHHNNLCGASFCPGAPESKSELCPCFIPQADGPKIGGHGRRVTRLISHENQESGKGLALHPSRSWDRH